MEKSHRDFLNAIASQYGKVKNGDKKAVIDACYLDIPWLEVQLEKSKKNYKRKKRVTRDDCE